MKAWLKQALTGLGEGKIGLLMIIFSLFIYFVNFSLIDAISDKIFDLNFKSRGTIESEKDVVLVAIDQKSQEKLGRWPWSRDVMVRLVEKLTEYNPKVIALDIVFSYPEERPDLELANKMMGKLESKGQEGTELYQNLNDVKKYADVDKRLAEAFKAAGNVVPGYFFFTVSEEVASLNLDNKSDYKIIRSSMYRQIKYPKNGRKDFPLKEGLGLKPNIKKLTKAANRTGYFNIFPDSDGVTRHLVNAMSFNKKLFPSAVIQMLAVYYGENPKIYFEDFGAAGIEIADRFVPTDEYARSIINYYGPEGEFPRVPVVDIIDGSLSDEELLKTIKNKIVIVGATAMGIYDIRHTPFGSMAGPEVEATFAQNVIDGIVPHKAGWFLLFDTLSIILLGVFLILMMRRVKIFAGGIVAVTIILSYAYFQRFMFVDKLVQLDVTYPVLSIIFVYSGISFYKYFIELTERQFIQSAFGQYLSPAIIEQLVEDPSKLQLGGVRKPMTVLFSDVAGFSSISEKLDPQNLVELLNDYLSEMSEIIMKFNGTVDKYEGDAIIAFFGAPLDDPEHSVNCCRAAVEMQVKLGQMREKWIEDGKAPLRMRIGVNSGQMVVGNMGSKTRMDYTIMGDAVNLAARLEGANKEYGTETMVSHFTYEECKDFFEFRELDSLKVVGKNEVTKVFEVLGLKSQLSEEKQKIVTLFHKGLDYYKSMDWEKAIVKFNEVLNIDEDDGPSITFLERSLDYQIRPPGKGWDGVHILMSK